MTSPAPVALLRPLRPRTWLVGVSGGAGAALLGSAGLLSRPLLGVAIVVVQAGLVMAWLSVLNAPGRAGGALIGIAAAGAADLVLVNREHQPAGGLMGVIALALVASVLHQVLRRPRRHPTASLAAEMSGVVLVVCFACLGGLNSEAVGRVALIAWTVTLAVSLPLGRIVDHKVTFLRFGSDIDRGIFGLIAGVGAGVAVGAYLGNRHFELGIRHGEILAGVTALTAYLADAVVVRGSSDVPVTDRRRVAALRPLAALLPLAAAAPATYVVGRLLLG